MDELKNLNRTLGFKKKPKKPKFGLFRFFFKPKKPRFFKAMSNSPATYATALHDAEKKQER